MSDEHSRKVVIRDYRPQDAPRLYHIDQICFPADIAFSRRELLFYLNHPAAVARVAETEGEIVGFALSRIQLGRMAHIVTLDVVPEMRRQKVGKNLMQSLHQVFAGRSVLLSVLEVSTMNGAALRLYESLNYQPMEKLRGYYRGREDALRMVRLFQEVAADSVVQS